MAVNCIWLRELEKDYPPDRRGATHAMARTRPSHRIMHKSCISHAKNGETPQHEWRLQAPSPCILRASCRACEAALQRLRRRSSSATRLARAYRLGAMRGAGQGGREQAAMRGQGGQRWKGVGRQLTSVSSRASEEVRSPAAARLAALDTCGEVGSRELVACDVKK